MVILHVTTSWMASGRSNVKTEQFRITLINKDERGELPKKLVDPRAVADSNA